jgi:hypothetical protein
MLESIGTNSSRCLHLLLVAKNCGSMACVTSLTGQAGIFNHGKVFDGGSFGQRRSQAKYLQFLVLWKGYGYEENTWSDENDVHTPDLV